MSLWYILPLFYMFQEFCITLITSKTKLLDNNRLICYVKNYETNQIHCLQVFVFLVFLYIKGVFGETLSEFWVSHALLLLIFVSPCYNVLIRSSLFSETKRESGVLTLNPDIFDESIFIFCKRLRFQRP